MSSWDWDHVVRLMGLGPCCEASWDWDYVVRLHGLGPCCEAHGTGTML